MTIQSSEPSSGMKNIQEFLARNLGDAFLHRSFLRLSLLAKQLLTPNGLRIWIETEEHGFVAKRVLFLGERPYRRINIQSLLHHQDPPYSSGQPDQRDGRRIESHQN